ncbi:dnaJ homolog subfamily C member 24 isoform X2 [Seriola aureovittata]|uniref:dnaJ homolog subfamily C member 24 isoform X2 n=1 Tax=Seriola aureovittata TaxID=2871759 RepID=UPI0024BED589|nr:dnaJ homolog subfamily C member 24 isoform X2 [Seriola aureovittata]
MCEAEKKDLYAVLGASPSDSVQQLRHRYQQLALQYHPDRLRGECPTEAESGLEKFLEVDAVWRILSDQNSRRQYDLQRRDEGVYSYCCRCGGGFSVSEEEVEEETQRRQHDDEEEETVEGQHRGVVVCCDTCSLSVYVTWSRHQQTPTLKCL